MKNQTLFIFGVLILVTLASCRGTRDRKAMGRVLSSPEMREQVYQIQSGLHPVLPPIPIYIPGKTDTFEITIPVDVVRDSIIRAECPTVNFDSLKLAWTRVIYHNRTDTILMQDTTIRRWYEDAVKENGSLQGQIIVKDKLLGERKKETNKQRWWTIGIGGLAVIIIGGLIYLLFKK